MANNHPKHSLDFKVLYIDRKLLERAFQQAYDIERTRMAAAMKAEKPFSTFGRNGQFCAITKFPVVAKQNGAHHEKERKK